MSAHVSVAREWMTVVTGRSVLSCFIDHNMHRPWISAKDEIINRRDEIIEGRGGTKSGNVVHFWMEFQGKVQMI